MKDKSVGAWLDVLMTAYNLIGPITGGSIVSGFLVLLWVKKLLTRKIFSNVKIIGKQQRAGSDSADRSHEKYRKYFENSLTCVLLTICGLILVIAWYHYKLENVPKSQILIDMQVGPGRKIKAVFNGAELVTNSANYKLMEICRALDSAVDPLSDVRIDKSKLFEIINGSIAIETPLNNTVLNQKENESRKVQCFLLLWPKVSSADDILTYGQALREGGILVMEHGHETNWANLFDRYSGANQ